MVLLTMSHCILFISTRCSSCHVHFSYKGCEFVSYVSIVLPRSWWNDEDCVHGLCIVDETESISRSVLSFACAALSYKLWCHKRHDCLWEINPQYSQHSMERVAYQAYRHPLILITHCSHSLQFIRESGTRWWNLRVHDLQMICINNWAIY